ncbi:MAG: hypothetical protein ABH827_01050 [bacterium]
MKNPSSFNYSKDTLSQEKKSVSKKALSGQHLFLYPANKEQPTRFIDWLNNKT